MKIAIHAAFFFEIPKYSKKALNISWMKIVEATILYINIKAIKSKAT
jgi:hypothetical protein